MTVAEKRIVQSGDRVRVNYIGAFADGEVFDSSEGHEPLEFTVGAKQVIAGFDEAVVGMQVGETRKVSVAPEQAYGSHEPAMVAEVDRKLVPEDERLQIGGFLEVCLEDGNNLEVQVVGLTETKVTFDANHPLAGKVLNFEIELLEFV